MMLCNWISDSIKTQQQTEGAAQLLTINSCLICNFINIYEASVFCFLQMNSIRAF